MTAPAGEPAVAARPEAGDDAYARRVRSPRYREERREKADVILALVGPRLRASERAADMGAGTGLVKKALEEETGKYIIGFEIDRQFIAWEEGMVVADALRLPVRRGSFDFVLLNHLYEHVEDQPGLFREAWRVLRPGGGAYVAAGNVLAVMEPHYRLPFLSWLPRPAADAYLRVTGRGRSYAGIRFRTRRSLLRMMERAGFRVRDLTEVALRELLGPGRGGRWGGWLPVWRVLERLPGPVRRALLGALSPQWFLVVEKPGEAMRDAGPGRGEA